MPKTIADRHGLINTIFLVAAFVEGNNETNKLVAGAVRLRAKSATELANSAHGT
jgi:hypothetical protein